MCKEFITLEKQQFVGNWLNSKKNDGATFVCSPMITPLDKIECMFNAYADDSVRSEVQPHKVAFAKLFYDTLQEVKQMSEIASLPVFEKSREFIEELISSQYFGEFNNFNQQIILVMMSQRELRHFLRPIVLTQIKNEDNASLQIKLTDLNTKSTIRTLKTALVLYAKLT